MVNNFVNRCTRCGKQRVISETHDENVGNSVVTYTQMSCPDPECQSKVEKQLDRDKEKRQNLIQNPTRGVNFSKKN